MNKIDIISRLFSLAFGLLIIILSLYLPVGTFSEPGEGLIPLITGVLMTIFSLSLCADIFLKGLETKCNAVIDQPNLKYVSITIISMVVFPIILEYAGFLLSALLLLLFLFRVVGKIRWRTSLLGSILASLSFYLIFSVWLKVQLPIGTIEYLLGA